MSIAVSKFISDLAIHFPPKHARPELETAWIRSMAEALRGYHPDVLEDAAKQIIATRKYTSFPLPAECKHACNAVAEYRQFICRSQTLPEFRTSTGDEWTSERVKLAYDLIKSGMGKEAARDGWVLALWNFARKNQRLPSGSEINACKREAEEFNAAYAECVKGGWPEARALEKLGSSMLAKREKLSAEVLGR